MVPLKYTVEPSPVFARTAVGPPRCSSVGTLGVYCRQVSRNSSWPGELTAVSGNDIGSLARNCGRWPPPPGGIHDPGIQKSTALGRPPPTNPPTKNKTQKNKPQTR